MTPDERAAAVRERMDAIEARLEARIAAARSRPVTLGDREHRFARRVARGLEVPVELVVPHAAPDACPFPRFRPVGLEELLTVLLVVVAAVTFAATVAQLAAAR